MSDDIPEYPTQRIRLQQCQICKRQFNVEILSKHQSICRKVTTKKRKVFDAGKQRATDSDVPYKATKKTAMVYSGQIRPQELQPKNKPNWREKHHQLIRSIREARGVTRAMKTGAPLPKFRASEVPSDYVMCPYCRRNFNEHAAKRHIPFCQSQRERKQGPPPPRNNQPLNRGRTLPLQNSSKYRDDPSEQSMDSQGYSSQYDSYNNGYKHSNSAPMPPRRRPVEFQQPPPPPPPPVKQSGGGWSLRKMFGFGSKEESQPPPNSYYQDEEDDYESSARYPPKQPVLMRTGRNQENTSLNVRARQRSDEHSASYRPRPGPPPAASPPSSYGPPRNQYGNGQYRAARPTAVGRAPPSQSSGVRCGECGGLFNNASARFCPQCGSRR